VILPGLASKFRYQTIGVLGFGMLGIALLWATYNAYVPIFLQAGRPDFSGGAGVRGFGLGATVTGFIMALDNMAAMLILPYIGALSDRTHTRWGRRKPYLVIGAPIAAAAFAVLPFAAAAGLPFFMGAIIVTLLAMDLFRTPLVALMPDLTPPSQRSPANGIMNMLGGFGAVLAFLVGGWLFRFSPAAPFLFGAAGMLVALLLVVALVREPTRPEMAEQPPGLIVSLTDVVRDRDRSALLLLGAIFCWFLCYGALETFFTSYAVDELGVDSGQASLLLAHFALAVLVGALPAGLIGARFGRRRSILTGLVLLAALLAWQFTLYSVPLVRLVLVLSGLAWSLILVNALPMILDCAPPARDGAYTGLYYLASQASAVVGPLLAGTVLDLAGNNYRVLFLYNPCALAAAFVLMRGVRRGEAPATMVYRE
jgi:MFS family permease